MARLKEYMEGSAPSYTLEDLPIQDYPREPVVPSFTLEDVAQGPTSEAIAKIARRNVSLTSPIPVANAPSGSDAVEAVSSALPATGPQTPAGKPNTAGMPNLPEPQTEGAGGDSERDLYLARLAAQNAAGFGGMGAGKNIDMGIADTLGERLKQVQALRAKREEQSLEQQRERATWGASNRGTLNSLLAQYKDNQVVSDALMALEPSLETTKPSDFQRASTGAILTRPKAEGIQATTKKTGAQGDVAAASAVAVPAKVDIARAAQAERELEGRRRDAREWARIRVGSRQAASKLTEGKPDAFRKEVNDKTQVLGTSIAKEYGEIASALQEADRAIIGVRGVSPDMFAKVAQATKMDSLNTPEERALFRSIGELRRAAQKAQSGLAVTEAERQEFLQTFGQNWMQDPTTLLEAIEWMRRKTQDKLNTSFATYRAQGEVGNTAVQAYEQAGGVTPNAEYLKPFSARTPKTATAPAPAAQVGGMVKVRHKASGKTATVDRAKADEMLKRPDFEEVK